MRSIVVYFSLEGNSKYVAEQIKKELSTDILEVEPLKNYPKGKVSKYFWGGKSVMFGEKPKLAPYKFDKKEYDLIIIGTPIWASNFAPPIKTFLADNNLSGKNVAFYACHAGGGAEKCFDKLKSELSKSEVITTLSLVNPFINKTQENEHQIEAFCEQIKHSVMN